MPFEFHRAVPILRIFDVDKAKDFYLGFLGFHLDWEHRFEPEAPLYMQISRGAVALHLSEHHGDGCPGHIMRIEVTGVAEYHAEITSKGYRYMRPGLDDQFGLGMTVYDPFNNRIRFHERQTH